MTGLPHDMPDMNQLGRLALVTSLALTLSLAAGCAAAPDASRSRAPTVASVPPARPAPHAVEASDTIVLASRDRRVLAAIQAALPGTRRVLVEASTRDEALVRSLRGAGLVVIETQGPIETHGPIDAAPQPASTSNVVRLVLAVDRSDARARSGSNEHEVVMWTDSDAHLRYRGSGAHVVTPVEPDAEPRRFEHLVITSGAPADFRARLATADLWPEMPGLEVERINADGTRRVRLLGYVNAYYEHPEGHLSLAGGHSARLSTPPELGQAFRAAAQAAQGKVTGPTTSLLAESQDRRRHTMIDAVGTCGDGWVSGGAVAVTGRARLRVNDGGASIGVDVDVTSIESTLLVSSWLALAAQYRDAVAKVTRAVKARRALTAVDYAPLASVHDRIRSGAGAAASLLEVDSLLRGLASAFRHASVDEALDALAVRCRPTAAEEDLRATLATIPPR